MQCPVGETSLPLIAIMDNVLFPGMSVPLCLQRSQSIAAVKAAEEGGKTMLVVAQRPGIVLEPTLTELYPVGVLARLGTVKHGTGQVEAQLHAVQRIRIRLLEPQGDYLQSTYEVLEEIHDLGVEVEALQKTLLEEVLQFAALDPSTGINSQAVAATSLPSQLYLLSLQLQLPLDSKQKVLQAESNLEGLKLMREFLQHEHQVIQLQKQLQSEANRDLSREQRDHLLRQELVNIQHELGEDPLGQADLVPLRKKLEGATLPPPARLEADRQLQQLERMTPASAEYYTARTYLELLVDLPWSESSTDLLDLARAREILEEDHYGLAQVKERILEYLAVMRLNPLAHAPILCFVGPPGTGKTSLGKSIARALGRNFERLSLGGMHDEAELRGHRRTYVGAMTGRLIQAIRRSKVNNPLLMLDEIDKLRQSYEGDPAAALLEVLDPAQNHEFHDNYLDVPFDLSKVFFITTANTVDGIPAPLLDRLEVIRLSGYSPEEKLEIAQRHLLPRLIHESGLESKGLSIPAATLESLILNYTSEAGVRQLERTIARLLRRLSLGLAEHGTIPGHVDAEQARQLLGSEDFTTPQRREPLDPGVAAGLAYTENGGQLLYVEASPLPSGEPFTLTGNLGEVMKESARTARSFLLARLLASDPPPMHIHVPAGAIPKDGPSAGLAMVCALLSAFSAVACRSDTAMTGEVTLCGLVLGVGGIKEKLLAAQRAGIRRVVLPRANEGSLADLPGHLLDQLELVLVNRVEEALHDILPGVTLSEPGPLAAVSE